MVERIRWGILGTGSIAAQFARGLSYLKDAELLAVGSRNRETAEAFAKRLGVVRPYSSYADLVADKDIDVVYIATPQFRHMEDCCLCLEAGKAVICEKPFTVSAEEAKQVIELAREKGLFCMEAMWMRFFPLMREVLSIVRDGTIGDAQLLIVDFGIPVEFSPTDRRFRAEIGGGALLDRGVYAVSLASLLFGRPSGVHSTATVGSTGSDEQVAVIFTYPEGQLAQITASLRSYTFNEAVIAGSKGRIRIHEPFIRPHKMTLRRFSADQTSASARPSLKSKLTSFAKSIPWVQRMYLRFDRLLSRSTKTRVRLFEGNGFNYEAAEVMRCLRSGVTESDTMPLDETLSVMETMDEIRRLWTSTDHR